MASVTACLKVARGICKVGQKLLNLMWTSYFDDFFSVEESSACKHTDLVISALFSILGWRLSQEKLVSYHTIFKVLGVELDFTMSGSGLTNVCNTSERVKEFCEQLDGILASNKLKRSEGERLSGRLQFACGQWFGRVARNHIRILPDHIRHARTQLSEDTHQALREIRHLIATNKPRRIMGSLSDHVHI